MEIERLPVGALQTNCYLAYLPERDDAVLVDPGADEETIRAALNGRTVAAVLLTHGHFDHTGALNAFAGAPVYLHAEDAPFLTDAALSVGEMYQDSAPRTGDLHLISEGDEIAAAGMVFTVLHTPGHTPGGVCYRVGDDLFTGDTLFHRGYGRTDFPRGDFHALMLSLRRLLKMPENLALHPGHGEESTLERERTHA